MNDDRPQGGALDGTNPERPLRVALDLTPLLGPPAGVHQVTAALLEALCRRRDVAPSGYVLSARAPARRVAALGAGLEIAVRRSRVPAAACHRSWRRWDRPRLARLARGADVVHGTNFTAPPVSRRPGKARAGSTRTGRRRTGSTRADSTHAGRRRAGRGRTRPARLITVYDLGLVTRPEWCSPAVRRMGRTLRRAVARGAHLHVTTLGDKAEAPEVLGADPARVHLAPPGVAAVGPGDAAAGRRLVGAERYVLALGATEPRKGLTALPPAVAALDDGVKLAVAGPVGGGEAALSRAVADHGLSDRFVRLGTVDAAARADLLHGAGALAFPSLFEGFGLPPLEAVAAGVPVAATAVGALPELLGPEIPLAAPGDLGAFADRLAAALGEPRAPAPAARARIAELTWESAAGRMAAVYRAVAAA